MKVVKTLLNLVLASILAISGCSILENKKTNLGFEYWNFPDLKHKHETHPGDKGFLFGDAGSTELKKEYFLNMNFQKDFGDEKFNPYGTVGFLLGYSRHAKKNENDLRPTGHHSGIYSKIFPLAPQLGVGIESKLNEGLSLGAEATSTVFWIDHGWDRFGKDESSDKETKVLYNIGPILKLNYGNGSGIKLKWAAGNERTWVASLGLVHRF